MKTAQAGNLVENLGPYNGRRFFRKHWYGFRHVCGAAAVGLHVQDTGGGIARRARRPEMVGHIDQEHRQRCGLRDPGRGDVQAVCQPPGLLGVSQGPRHGASSAILGHEPRGGAVRSTAAAHNMRACLGTPGGLRQDDDRQGVRARLVAPLPLVQARLNVPLTRGVFEGWPREMLGRPRGARLAPGTASSLGPRSRKGARRITPQRGKEVQAARARHLQGVVGATVPVQHQRGPREDRGEPLEQGGPQGWDPRQLRAQRRGGFRGVRAALRSSQPPRSLGRFGGLAGRLGLAGSLGRVAADHLGAAPRKRPPFVDPPAGQGEAGEPWHRLAIQTGEETLEALGGLAGFGAHDCIARANGDIRRAVHLGTKEPPQQHGPREDGGEQTRDGALPPPCADPAGDAQHRETSRHDQQSQRDPTQSAGGRRGAMGSKTLAKCDNVPQGLLRRLRAVVVGDDNSTTGLRQKPSHVHKFWRRY